MTDQATHDWLKQACMDLILHMVDGDADAAADQLGAIGERLGHHGVYSLCCALAHIVMANGLGVQHRGAAFTRPVVIGPLGQQIAPEDAAPETRPHTWAARFVAAYANGDADQAHALFVADLRDPERHIDNVCALIGMAAGVVGHKLKENT